MRPVPTVAQTWDEAVAKQNKRISTNKRTSTMETCEQRRAREYGIDRPRDTADPTAWNARTIERESC